MAARHPDDYVRKQIEEKREQRKERGDKIDVASEDSFPASDSPSFTPVKGEKKNDIKELAKKQADKHTEKAPS